MVKSTNKNGANTNRPELQKMLDYIREGDIVLVTELDRLGRNNQDLTKIMNTIQNKSATLDVLNLPSMTGIADPNLRQLMTNLIIELYKYQAESERKRIIERQQQGIALAKQQGKYHGRKPQYVKDDPRLQHAFKLYQAGMSDVDVARNTGIKRTTLALCQILLMGHFRRRPVLAPGAAFFQLPFPFDAIGSGR